MDKLRDVFQSRRYDGELAKIHGDARAADQATHAVTFALARHPERGFSVPGTPFSIWPVYIEGREYVIYYTYTDLQVELVSILSGQDDFGG